ncbi:uncharacterized protein BBA_09950 [Beauveria bassiana ARSEF 2860]|uniref:Peptidase S1 domain-containing protein n=1 Tax=Beauveria bassiana (strain ARSEF 2860) TaxID=655819 RepID=J5J2R4_BEAB2|nr:uncharacterized protein BBA_09950 [Beauveria bassiana ARSEF 2860]EJP61113.1 hypothetical protein BBA_09950 [Beauveria bassiana ARSEF 2860]
MLSATGGPLIDSKTGTLVGLVSISVGNKKKVYCADAGIFIRIGSYLDFINKNLGEGGFTDGDNQRIKDEAKMAVLRPTLLKACKAKHSDEYDICLKKASAALLSGTKGEEEPTLEQWTAYFQDSAECDAFKVKEGACDDCAEKANVDSTVETVIQCSEAENKGN